MKREELLKKIADQARRDARNRRDPRFLKTMGLLVAKGLLRTNYPVPRRPNQKLFLADALWAGREVEPRILEVLPAAVLRLRAHFDFSLEEYPDLLRVLRAMQRGGESGPDFHGVPYRKLKVWADLPLPDRRVKPLSEKKIVRTFRLRPEVVVALRARAREAGCSETELLERKILAS
jgi:hypothetical protein